MKRAPIESMFLFPQECYCALKGSFLKLDRMCRRM